MGGGWRQPPPLSTTGRSRPPHPPSSPLTFASGDVAEADLGGLVPVLVGALGPVPRPAVGFGPCVLRHGRPATDGDR